MEAGFIVLRFEPLLNWNRFLVDQQRVLNSLNSTSSLYLALQLKRSNLHFRLLCFLDKLLANLFNIRPEKQQQQYSQSNQQQFWNSGISSSQWNIETFGDLTQGNQGSLRPPLHGNQGNLRPLGQGNQVYQKPWSGAYANMNQENQKLELKKEFLKNLKSGISDHIFRKIIV